MAAVYDYLKGLNNSAFNFFNPFSNQGFSQEELQAREEEFSNPSYMWNSYYLQREKMEETLDRINYIKRTKELRLELKETRLKILGKDMEETEETKKMFEEYDKELEALEFQKKIQIAGLNYAQKNLGGIQKYVFAPLYDVLVDVSNPTDIGDLISVGRVGVSLASAGVGAAVAKGAGSIGLGTVGKIVGAEAVISVADTALDVARIKDETGKELDNSDIAKLYGANVAGGLVMNGLMAGGGYAFRTIFNKVKGRVNSAGASAMNTPGANRTGPDGTPNPDMSQAPRTALKQALGEESGEQMADVIKSAELSKFDTFDMSNEIAKASTLDMGTTTPAERKVMNITLTDYMAKNIDAPIPESEFLNLPKTRDFINVEMNTRTNKIMTDLSQMIANYARIYTNILEEIALKKDIKAIDLINSNQAPLFAREWVNNISIIKEKISTTLSKQINFNISSRGSEIGINNYVDFVKYSQDNGIDIFKAMYTGILPDNLPQPYKEVFGYVSDLTFKYSIEVNPREVFGENDYLIETASKYGANNLFVGLEYEPKDWNFDIDGVPMMINPRLTSDEALELVTKIRAELQNELSGRIDLAKVVQDYADLEMSSYDDGIVRILEENLSQSRLNLINKLREYGLNKRQASVVYSVFNKARRNIEDINVNGLDLVDEIIKDFGKRNTIKNRLFNFIPKNDAMSDVDLFRVTTDGKGNVIRNKRFATKDEVTNSRKFTQAELDRRDEIEQMVTKYLGGPINPNVEKAFWGINIPLAQGRTKTVDIRTTDISQLADIYFKEKGVLKKDWRELTPKDKARLLDEIGLTLHTRMVENVGTVVRQQTGIEDISNYVDFMLSKWDIDKNKIKIMINENADIYSGYIRDNKDGTYLINLDFTSDMNTDIKLGVARHELQHIYDSMILGTKDIEGFKSYQVKFKNIPTVADTDVFKRIEKGQPVTVREFLGTFYNNHFYSPINDNFENNYLAAVAREKFNNRTPYEKAQDFFSLLDATTQGRVTDRTHVKEIFRFLQDAEDIPDYLDADFYQDFAIKSFIRPDDMFDFVNFLADKGNNRIRNMNTNYSKILSRMVTEEQGFSINTLLAQLNTNKLKRDLQGIYDDVNDLKNTVLGTVIGDIRKEVRDRFITRGGRQDDPTSLPSLFSSAVTSALIGTRQFTEAITSPVMAGTAHVLAGGKFSEGAMIAIKNLPLAYKNYIKSYIYAGGTAVENVGEFFNVGINAASQTILKRQMEQTFTLHLADTLHKIGDIKNSNVTLFDAKEFSDFTTQMAILNAGADPDAFIGRMARIFNRSVHGNKADDIQLQAIAEKVARSEFIKMLGVSDVSQLNQIQKQMYTMSGLDNSEFGKWQVYARNVVSEHGLDFPQDAFSLKMMLAQGEGSIDLIGMSRRTTKGERISFLYMCQTMFNAAKLALQKLKATSVNGFQIEHMDTMQIAKIMGILGVASIGVVAMLPKQQVEKIIFGNRTMLDDMDKAYDTWERDKKKGSYLMAKTFLETGFEQTPFAYTVNPSSNAFGVYGAGYSLFDRNVFDVSKGEARSGLLTLSIFASPIVSSRLTMLAKKYDKKGGGSVPINKAQLTQQLADDIETFLPYSYKSTTKKMKRQQKMNEFSIWGK